MKIKALVAGLLAAASFSASADTAFSGPVVGTSFTNFYIGTIKVTDLSDVMGSVFAADSVSYTPGFSLTLDKVTFSGAGLSSLSGDLDPSAAGFSFHNVAAGYYDIWASGSLSPTGQVPKLALLGASYTVTAVPEPETYGMLLGGLAVMGAIARRKAKKAA